MDIKIISIYLFQLENKAGFNVFLINISREKIQTRYVSLPLDTQSWLDCLWHSLGCHGSINLYVVLMQKKKIMSTFIILKLDSFKRQKAVRNLRREDVYYIEQKTYLVYSFLYRGTNISSIFPQVFYKRCAECHPAVNCHILHRTHTLM